MRPLRVVVAPDKFKGSLTAAQAADAMRAGVRDVVPDAQLQTLPMADGGEGTLEAVLAAGGRFVEVTVAGPTSEPVAAGFAILDGIAYVESARACGTEFVEPSPWAALHAHTWGVGELIATAFDHEVRGVVLTVGGTASTDGGAGMLAALGCALLGLDGRHVGLGGAALAGVRSVDLAPARARQAAVPFHVATDVRNPLLGPAGAAAVFGPQKGAAPKDVPVLDHALRAWAAALTRAGAPDPTDLPGAGAGGGLAAGAVAGLDATLVQGFPLLAELLGLDAALASADLAVTGEGSLDRQSLAGKVPAGVAAAARARGVATIAIAGKVELDGDTLVKAGFHGVGALVDRAGSPAEARQHAAALLREETAVRVELWLHDAGRPDRTYSHDKDKDNHALH
jgi:glycerate kinase